MFVSIHSHVRLSPAHMFGCLATSSDQSSAARCRLRWLIDSRCILNKQMSSLTSGNSLSTLPLSLAGCTIRGSACAPAEPRASAALRPRAGSEPWLEEDALSRETAAEYSSVPPLLANTQPSLALCFQNLCACANRNGRRWYACAIYFATPTYLTFCWVVSERQNHQRSREKVALVIELAEMLRLFQVNEGRFVDLEGELTPNSRWGRAPAAACWSVCAAFIHVCVFVACVIRTWLYKSPASCASSRQQLQHASNKVK